MTWNKNNPRFRRSTSNKNLKRKRQSNGLLNRLGGKVNSLLKGNTKNLDVQPEVPLNLFEDLKLVTPKPKTIQLNKADSPVLKTVEEESFNLRTAREVGEKTRTLKGRENQSLKGPLRSLNVSEPQNIKKSLEAKSLDGKKNGVLAKKIEKDLKKISNNIRKADSEDKEASYKIKRLGQKCQNDTRANINEKTRSGLNCDPTHKRIFRELAKPSIENTEFLKKAELKPNKINLQKTVNGRKFKEQEVSPPPQTAKQFKVEADEDFKLELDTTSLIEAEKSSIVKRKNTKLFIILISLFCCLALLSGVSYYFLFNKNAQRPVAKVTRLPQASLPKIASIAPGFFEYYASELEKSVKNEVKIEEGGSLGIALEKLGLGAGQNISSLIAYMTKDGIVPVVQPGDVIRVFWKDLRKVELSRLEYRPNPLLGKADIQPLIIMRRPDGVGFWHYSPTTPLLTLQAAKESIIESSLWAAGNKVGLDSGIISSITEVLASDIDFMTNIQRGDNFQVLYSREYRDGRPKGEPIIDMVKLNTGGRSYEYYRYVSKGDQVSYFDPEGRSSHKAFFMTPLQYKRISSHFTMTRMHPIKKQVRPHQGVDYAAPSGTPVSSVADGEVIFCGWNGGYGKLITIKHDEVYTTMYAHLSKFAKDISKGSVVKQGDLIGYVGSTGLSTGPHLDFRMKRHGVFINPLPVLSEQKGQELRAEEKQIFVENILTPLRDDMTRMLLVNKELL